MLVLLFALLGVGGDIPPVPARAPDRFAVMAFENRSGVHALDWATAGVPLSLAEKIEAHVGLVPGYGPWVVPEGPVVPANPITVAAFATRVDARWVWTGYVERPSWQLRVGMTLWRVDAGVAAPVAEVVRTGPFADVHAMIGGNATDALGRAGFTVTADLGAPVAKDFYAFTLLGRGVARARGTLGAIDLEAARRDLERAVFIEPTMPVGQRMVGEIWLLSPKEVHRAPGKFAYAVDLAPDYLPALRAAARTARPEVARELHERVVRLAPWDLEARARLGEAMWHVGDGEGALRELERVIARDPEHLAARRLIALVHADRGDTRALVAALEEIARRAPGDLEVRMDLGAAYAQLGRWEDARAAYVTVATARPTDATVLKLVGDVELRRGDAAAATAWYARMEKAAPADPRPPFLIGRAWLAAGDLERAHKAFIRAQDVRDYVAQAFAALGAVQYRAGKLDEALWYLRRAAQRRPHRAAARLALARVLLAKQQGAAALSQVAAARTRGAEGAEVDYLAALAHGQAGDLETARATARAAIAADPTFAPARAAQVALDRGQVPAVEGAIALDVPFGDVDVYERTIDEFLAAEAALAAVRKAFDDELLAALAALGEGPGKDLSREAMRRPRRRTCPVAAIALPWAATRRLEKAYLRRGLVLEQAYRRVALLDALGESEGLTPDYRRKVAEVRAGWRRALVGVRELRAELTSGLGRELRARRCKENVLAAAAARPELYGVRTRAPAPVAPDVKPAPRRAVTATLYIDNRECAHPVELWIDGEKIGEAPGGQRSAFEASVGQRSLCLLVPGTPGSCGDRGTVRQAYLHDGWSTVLHCRD